MFKLNKSSVFFGLLILIAIILISYILFVIIDPQKEPDSIYRGINDPAENTPTKEDKVGFEIVRSGRIEHDFVLKKIYEVVIEQTDQETVKYVAEQIIEDETKENNDIDEIHLMFFSSKELIDIQSYDVAEAIWGPRTLTNITKEIAEQNLRDNYEIRIIMKGDELEGFEGIRAEDLFGPDGERRILPE